MTNPNFDLNFELDVFSDLGAQFERALGDGIRDRTLAKLGNPLRTIGDPYLVKAELGVDTDTPGMVWIHQGDDTSDDETGETDRVGAPALALNAGEGRLDDKELIFGTPVWVRRQGNELYILGTGGRAAAEYLHNTAIRPQASVNISQLDYALLKPTVPPSMRVWFSGAYPVLDGLAYRGGAQLTAALDASPLTPPASDMAKAILIEYEPSTDSLILTEGADFDYDVTIDNPPHEIAFNGFYPVTIDPARFLLGWVRVYNGQTSITQKDILPAQELMSKGGGGAAALDDLTDVTITSPAQYHTFGYTGSIWANVKNTVTTTNPTAGDDNLDGYTIGSRWLNTSASKEWVALNVSTGAAVWLDLTAIGSHTHSLATDITDEGALAYLNTVGTSQIDNSAVTAAKVDTSSGVMTTSATQTVSNKNISSSANTVTIGTEVTKTLSGDILAVGTDRNILVSSESGFSDNLKEITGLSVGESIWLRATPSHTINVNHNNGTATIKIHLRHNTNINLDEQNPLRLTLVATNVLAEPDQTAANLTLSNISSVNTNLIPTSTSTKNLGGTVASWNDGYIDTVYLREQSTPSTPGSGFAAIYPQSDGYLYFINDSGDEYNLAVPTPTVDGIQLVDPTLQTWTARNAAAGGTFTEDLTNKRLRIVADGDGTADIRGWSTPAPVTGYEIRMLVELWTPTNTFNNGLAIGWRDSTSGELALLEITTNTTTFLSFLYEKWNSETSSNSTYIAQTGIHIPIKWVKIADNLTNRSIHVSNDGVEWVQLDSRSSTDFLTPDEIFFGVRLVTNGTYDMMTSLLSYEEI